MNPSKNTGPLTIFFLALTVGCSIAYQFAPLNLDTFKRVLPFWVFGDSNLRLQAISTPDVSVKTFSCGSGWSWEIIEKERFHKKQGFASSDVSRMETFRNLHLVSPRGVVGVMTYADFGGDNYTNGTPMQLDAFPAADPFLKAYTFGDSSVFLRNPQEGLRDNTHAHSLRSQLRISSSKITIDEFDSVAHCLFENLKEIEELYLTQKNLGTFLSAPIGWLQLVDDNLDSFVREFKTYRCADGSRVALSMNMLVAPQDQEAETYTSNASVLGIVRTDGRVYPQVHSGAALDVLQPIAIPHTPCISQDGGSLESVIASIPDKIIFLK